MTLNLEEGASLVRYSREVIASRFKGKKPGIPENLRKIFSEKRGVFVTLHKYPDNQLRGCIGYPEPVLKLGDAVRESAHSAAFGDPRFKNLEENELNSIVIEVSVLTLPELIVVEKPVGYVKAVKVGRDGLIIDDGMLRGLLLPQVAVEQGWDAETFLSQTCVKAGLTPDCWLLKGIRVYKFSAQIFSEETPNGDVVEKALTD
ncbi:MAG: TIGR00296 family protein [Candidatus Altiarchaeota archaeon]